MIIPYNAHTFQADSMLTSILEKGKDTIHESILSNIFDSTTRLFTIRFLNGINHENVQSPIENSTIRNITGIVRRLVRIKYVGKPVKLYITIGVVPICAATETDIRSLTHPPTLERVLSISEINGPKSRIESTAQNDSLNPISKREAGFTTSMIRAVKARVLIDKPSRPMAL